MLFFMGGAVALTAIVGIIAYFGANEEPIR